ncbi:MAG: hypothetical protein U5K28_02460 [Halobacteriales archaeon]|nr:hypothetical protein [Halobacteriales archaeon]
MFDRLVAVDSALSENQKLFSGAVVLALGMVLIGLMAFSALATELLKPILGVLGALCIIVGTLLVGTSEDRDHAV